MEIYRNLYLYHSYVQRKRNSDLILSRGVARPWQNTTSTADLVAKQLCNAIDVSATIIALHGTNAKQVLVYRFSCDSIMVHWSRTDVIQRAIIRWLFLFVAELYFNEIQFIEGYIAKYYVVHHIIPEIASELRMQSTSNRIGDA